MGYGAGEETGPYLRLTELVRAPARTRIPCYYARGQKSSIEVGERQPWLISIHRGF
jgi:hypothetical protein